jgi:serine/threonine protein kinase/WD40 repeat protein
MTTGQLDEEAVFHLARQISDGAARAAYLDQVCGRDAALRQRVEGLLQVHEHEDEFLKSNPGGTISFEHATITEGPGTRIDRYKLLQKIGEGGFGVVYMAEQKEPVKRRVALKIVKLGMDTKQVIARFESERQALALMDHPHVAKVLDAGATETGRPYFVMELVKGVPITKYCDDNQLTTRQRLELFIPVCNAVQHAHLKGIIHRDIKPSNILVTMHDGVPVPKVIDFGIAKATQQELTEKTLFTEFGQIIGTPAYMSPEQAEMSGLDIDTRTDIYSLGVLLYELLAGHTPIDAHDLMRGGYDEIRRRIKEEEPRKPSTRVSTLADEERTSVARCRGVGPSQLTSELKGDLDWIVLKALEKDRTRRYLTASSFAEDVKRHLNSEPVLAAAPSASYRVRKYVRRNSAALAVAATIAGLLVAGTILSSVQWLRAERARANETAQRIRAESKEQEANDERRRAEAERAAAAKAQREATRLAYARAMQLAQSDWERGSLARLKQTLADTESYPDRGFEWYYWQAQLHQESRTIYPQLGELWGVRLAADQRDILVNNARRTYRLEAATGNVRAAYGSGPMSTDGRWLAQGPRGENDRTVDVIDTTTGMRTAVRLPESQQTVSLSPDGRRLITMDYGDRSSLHMWDVATSTQDDEIKVTPPAWFSNAVQFSPDGQWFAGTVFAEKPEIDLRRVSDGEQTRAAQGVRGQFLGFTPDSRHLASWDTTTGLIHLHSTADLSDVKQVPCERGPGQVAFSADGTYVAIASGDRSDDIVIHEVETGRRVSKYRVHQHSGIAFSHDGHELIVCSTDGTVKFFPVESRDYIHVGGSVWSVQLSGDGTRLLFGTDSGPRLIDVASRELLATYPFSSPVGVFPDGRHIATVPYDDSDENRSTTITIADDKGEPVRFLEHDDRVSTLVVAPDGRHIFVEGPGYFDCVLDAETGEKIFQHRSNELRSFGFSPDGKRFAVVFVGEPQIRFYDAATGRQIDSIPCEPNLNSNWIQFSLDGKRVATAYENAAASDYGVSVYDIATKQRIQRITGHGARVGVAYFLPDDRRLFTKSSDGTTRLWDVENGFELLSLGDDGHVELLQGRALSPDGRLITIAGREGVFLKEAATPEQVAIWQKPPTPPTDTNWWERLGGIQDWLVLAPIHLREGKYLEDLDRQQLADEANLDPNAGEVVPVEGEKFTWQRATTSDCVLDFQEVTSPGADHCLAYAVTHIYSDAPREEVRLLIGSDDLAKVYLNGKAIYQCPNRRSAIPADDEVLIDLRKGKNVLVCKVIDDFQDWGLSAQVVGQDYRPIPGVTTGTNR